MHDKAIDKLKGISILGVIICHLGFVNKLNHNVIETIYYLQYFFSWCVMGFFFCSGYLEKNWGDDFWKWSSTKVKRLLVPLIVFELTFKFLLLLLSIVGFYPLNITWIDFIISFSAPQTYYLYVLFIGFILAKLLLFYLNLNEKFIFLLMLSIIPFINIPDIAYGNDFILYPYYYLCFFSGVVIRQANKNYITGITFIVQILVYWWCGIDMLLISMVPLSLYILFKYLFGKFSFSLLVILGRYSSSIYIWHAPFILPFFVIAFSSFLGGSWLTVLLSLTLTILLSMVLKVVTTNFSIFRLWYF